MLAYTIILIVAQHLVSADQEQQRTTFIVGQILKDIDCQLTNTTCGKNMIFVPYLFDTTKNSSSYWNCIQRCSCTTDSYEEIDGQCIEQKNDATAKNITSSTYDCSLEGLPCGTNMIFNPVHEINFQNTSQCITQCVCDINYYEENDQCIKKNDILSAYMDNPCNLEPCKVDEIIHDAGCRLTGHKCGINMIFKLISQGITYPSISRYCTQRCVCESEEFVAKTFHCEKTKIHLNDSIESSEFLQYCPRLRYNMDEEITDLGCRLTGFKCGKNMVFVPVEEFFVSENLDPIIGCIQRCKCKEAFIYSKKDGECKKKWYCDGGYCSLGKQVFDYGCMLTGLPCGTNMIFDTMNNNSTEFCIQVCKCAANDYTEINGRCHKEDNTTSKYFVEVRKSFIVGQIFDDFGCFSTGITCGKNMVFRPIFQFHNISGLIWYKKCLQRCSCKNDKYIERNKNCIKRMVEIENPPEKNTTMIDRPCFINRSCQLGDTIIDKGCQLSGLKCGTNMKFSPIIFVLNICIQHCLCDNESFISNRKSCTNRNFLVSNNLSNHHESSRKNRKKKGKILLNCLHGNCSLSQEIIDYGCKLEGHSCGPNMTFRMADKEMLEDAKNVKCTLICECASEFYEKGGQCIEKEQQNISYQYENPCARRICSVGEMFFDEDCHLTEQQCGKNMIFTINIRGTIFASNSQYCYQRCSCKSDEFVEKFLECEKKDKIYPISEIHQNNKNCPHDYHYKYEEEILDLGCRLTGQRCAPTMVFRTIQIFSNNCMQQCTCGEEYNYNEEEGECIRNWYCEGRYCEYGKKIYDYGCALTSMKCGTNMKFSTLEEIDDGNCIQVCSCISDNYVEINGKCIKKT